MSVRIGEAADQWEDAKRTIEAETARLNAAAAVLKDWFHTSGKQHYRSRIGYARSTYLALDTEAVKTELGDRLPDFQTRRERETLSLLT